MALGVASEAVRIAERPTLITDFLVPDMPGNQLAAVGTVLNFKRQITRVALYPLTHLCLLRLAWRVGQDKFIGRRLNHHHAVIA